MIRILVTGSRLWDDIPLLAAALDQTADGHDRVTVVHGRCDPRTPDGTRVDWDQALADPTLRLLLGADWHAHQHATAHGWTVEEHRANWRLHGNAAGAIRNQHMVSLGADVTVAAPLGNSPGTRDCMRRARAAGIRVVDVTKPPEPEGLWSQ